MISAGKYAVLGLLLSTTSGSILFAQQQNLVNTHTISGTYLSQQISDQYLGNNQVKLNTRGLSYAYTTRSTLRIKKWQASWNTGSANTMQVQQYKLQYSDLFAMISSHNKRFKAYLGYDLSTSPLYLKLKTEGNSPYSWATSSGLSVYQQSSYSWKRQTITAAIIIPVAGFAARPRADKIYQTDWKALLYNSYDEAVFTSLHNLQAATIEVKYEGQLSKRISLQVGYQYSHVKLKEQPGFEQKQNGVQVGVSYSVR